MNINDESTTYSMVNPDSEFFYRCERLARAELDDILPHVIEKHSVKHYGGRWVGGGYGGQPDHHGHRGYGSWGGYGGNASYGGGYRSHDGYGGYGGGYGGSRGDSDGYYK
jgi:hypothetical protein